MKLLLAFFIFLLLLPVSAHAGGSDELVEVVSLDRGFLGSFEISVRPQPQESSYKDPYMGECELFVVSGRYDFLRWMFSKFMSYDRHEKALEFIADAKKSKRAVRFGWMGSGFHIDYPKSPCVARSKALQYWKEGDDEVVLSFYNPT